MAFYDGSTASNGDVPVTESEQFFNDPNWTFQDSPPFDTYDTTSFYQDDWNVGPQPLLDSNQTLRQQSADLPQSTIAPELVHGLPTEGPMGMANPVQSGLNLPAGALSTLSEAQRQKLQQIAMPSHLHYHSPKSEPSPDSAGSRRKSISVSSPEGHSQSSNTNSRKRKASADDDEDDEEDIDGQPVKKTAHNMIEKRYRTNLNDKIAALRDSVPSLRIMSKSAKGEDTTGDREELHGLTPAHKLNKATVLSKATEYIRHLEKRNNRLLDENSAMQARIAAFEKLFMAGAMNGGMSPIQQQSPTPIQYQQDGFVNSPMPTPGRADPPGMIQVPEDMKRILAAQIAAGQPYPVPQQNFRSNPALLRQQQIQQQQQQQQQAHGRGWHNAGPYFGKLMVGSLAGLMLLEAVHENDGSNEAPEGRGLFALPLQLLRTLMSSMGLNLMGYHVASAEVIFSLKLVLLLGSLCWAFFPPLFKQMGSNPKASQISQAALEAVPSLASPIHVRRQAWLTAIQTVWVPRHNFFLEVAALGLKTLKLSLRNIIGVHGYQMLTGQTEDLEVGRVKAWTIALDAQLAGGDVEISKSRLTLTLLASGTLPDTPLRLMLKALHIRVLLWEAGLTGMKLGVLNTIASKMARVKWNEAKRLHRLLTQLRRGGQEPLDDDLPDHLAVLLEQDADEVLQPSIVQRAHNLAWNRPTKHNAIGFSDGMDSVVDDTAVRSPMDAVAAWWSSLTLLTALTDSLLQLDNEDSEARQLVEDGIKLAIRAAPIGSVAQNRAIVARAVLFNEKRGANIAAVIQAVGPLQNSSNAAESSVSGEMTPPATPHMDIPTSILSEDEIYMCLQCAKAIAHLQRYAPPDEPVSVYPIIDEIHVSNEMSLLGYTAAFTLMEYLAGHEFAAEACDGALERLSGSLRIWTAKDCWLEPEVKEKMVQRCLAVTRNAVGMDMETDTGYGSISSNENECENASDASVLDRLSQSVVM